MSFMRLAACTTVLAALSAGAVSAEPALVTTNVNLRQGPGTTYQITTTIPGGSTVDVSQLHQPMVPGHVAGTERLRHRDEPR